jgi:hypothetical protein
MAFMADVQGWLFDYEGVYAPTLWANPVDVATTLGLDPDDTDQLAQAADVVAEASSILDQYTGRRFGPARCLAVTYRMRGFPLLNLTPPAANIVKVILLHDECNPNQPVPMIDEETPVSQQGAPVAPDLTYSRNLVALLAGLGESGVVAVPGSEDPNAQFSWCLDSSRLLRISGASRFGAATCDSPFCSGTGASPLVTVFYRSQENWPPGLRRALDALIAGLHTGADCTPLPPKTTSVTRQGVAWQVEESEGVTGIPYVDKWISRNRPGIRLKDPMHASITQAQYIDCEAFYPFYAPDQYSGFGTEFSGELLPDAVQTDPLGLLP